MWRMNQADTFWQISGVGWAALTAVGSLATAVVAAGAAIVALRQLGEATRLRRDESRPYVIADIEPGPSSNTIIDFVLRNIGKTPAYDLSLTWVDPPVRAQELANYEFKDMHMFHAPTPMLAPGRVIRTWFDSTIERGQRPDLGSRFELKLRYRAHPTSEEWFEEPALIDLDTVKGAAYAENKRLHDLVKAVEEIGNKLP
jgi:hypothetical protein